MIVSPVSPQYLHLRGKCWRRTSMQREDSLFFLFVSISVIAGPDYLEGPINRPQCVCVALKLQKTGEGVTGRHACRGHEVVTNSSRVWNDTQDDACPAAMAPLQTRICQKLQRVLSGLPTPILSNKSLTASATFWRQRWIHQVRATEIISTRA